MPRLAAVPKVAKDQTRQSPEHASAPEVRHRTVYLSARQALTYLDLPSLGSLYWHIANNSLPTKRIGRRYRFDTRELDQWMNGVKGIELVLARRRA